MIRSIFLALLILFFSGASYGFKEYDYVPSSELNADLAEGVIMNDTAYTFSEDWTAENLAYWLEQNAIREYYKSKAKDICFLARTRSVNYKPNEQKELYELLKLSLRLDCEEYKEATNADLLVEKLTGPIAVDYGLLEVNSFDLATLEKILPEEAFVYVEYFRSSGGGSSKKVIQKEVGRGKASNIFSVADLKAWFAQPMIRKYFQTWGEMCYPLEFRQYNDYYTPETLKARDAFLSELGVTCKGWSK